MDFYSPETLQNILLGVAGNGLTSVLAFYSLRLKDSLSAKQKQILKDIVDKRLPNIMDRSLEDFKNDFDWTDRDNLELVCLFLESPEVDLVIRKIYSSSLFNDNKDIVDLRDEFISLFMIYVGSDGSDQNDNGGYLFSLLLNNIELNLNIAIESGIISAIDAKSSIRHNIILRELKEIQRKIEDIRLYKKSDVKIINLFEEDLRKMVSVREKYIRPPFIDISRKFLIDEIYVIPNFQTTHNDDITMDELNANIHRTVILGNPGAGKSTFTQKLCFDLTEKYSDKMISNRLLTPVRIILRDYGEEKKVSNFSIIEYIKYISSVNYQIQAPDGAFEYLLSNGRLLVLFDGLDELVDTSYRQEISNDIETFSARYPSTPIIVTSREVGYDQAPLDEKVFDVYHLSAFAQTQVEDYVNKWFQIYTELNKDEQERKINSFLLESEGLDDVRSNPLMLALMCNIYRGENYIPRNRPDVYKKCTEMLFERWDKGRGIQVFLPMEAHLKPTMMFLAHWIYSEPKFQKGVVEDYLINKATGYLYPKKINDKDEAETIARKFIEFCKGRAWVFTDTGTTNLGERLYQFTHRTFLEYFTAMFLTRMNPTPPRLVKILMPRIAKKEWDVVCQLAYHIMSGNGEDLGDELLINTMKIGKKYKQDENISVFIATCLKFIIPSYDVINSCVSYIYDSLYKNAINILNDKKLYRFNNASFDDALRLFFQYPLEIRKSVLDILNSIIKKDIFEGDIISKALAFDIMIFIEDMKGHIAKEDIQGYIWDSNNIIDDYIEIYEEACGIHPYLSIYFLYKKNDISIMISKHGIKPIFDSSTSFVQRRSYANLMCLIDSCLMIDKDDKEIIVNHRKLISDIVDYIYKNRYQNIVIYENPEAYFGLVGNFVYPKKRGVNVINISEDFEIDDEFMFILGIMFAIDLEKHKKDIDMTVLSKKFIPDKLLPMVTCLLSRFLENKNQDLSYIESLQIAPDKKEALVGWIKGEFTFLSIAFESL
ncbi:NACHT domain-containing protein [Herpetosiphon gulosus]|uniref:NACHT domain-containing protein n=1 Tax=Herpetosiphon gulosus TaxID=1973496 RepID=A0ABP9X759_9CHLR